ncbi:hypothetical protein [Streptomyces sp. NPDC007369]|uniref:hypothetical protein n=1 Tax=Streptomyces sp. NPDC007369 TaxID=3154589 RepID=UPI00340C23BD
MTIFISAAVASVHRGNTVLGMRMKNFAVAGFVGLLLLTACSAGADADEKPLFPELPQKIESPVPEAPSELQPSPPADAPFHERVAFGLRERILDMANTRGSTTGWCPADLTLKDGVEATCVTTYEGLQIEWDVIVGRTNHNGRPYEWSAEPRAAILTRDGAANAIYGYFGPDVVRCSDIPAAVVVPISAWSGHTCQTVHGGKAGKPMKIEMGLVGPRFTCRERELHACIG